ncbi:hypothetical protein D3C87_1935420 [compost metagenome]
MQLTVPVSPQFGHIDVRERLLHPALRVVGETRDLLRSKLEDVTAVRVIVDTKVGTEYFCLGWA